MESIKILVTFFVLINISEISAQARVPLENIVFPAKDTNENRTATHPRIPVQDYKRCDPHTEYLYAGDNIADWVCDCKPAYLFHPQTQRCHQALTRGPCNEGHYLILNKDSAIPKCEINPCRVDGYVLYQNRCYRLGDEEVCAHYKRLTGRKVKLAVNPTTLTVVCQDEDDKFICGNNCCIGSLRYSDGKCDNKQN